MHKQGEECQGETGASDGKSSLFLLRFFKFLKFNVYYLDDIKPMLSHEPPTTEKAKCFVACMNKKMGFVSIKFALILHYQVF